MFVLRVNSFVIQTEKQGAPVSLPPGLLPPNCCGRKLEELWFFTEHVAWWPRTELFRAYEVCGFHWIPNVDCKLLMFFHQPQVGDVSIHLRVDSGESILG